MLLVNLDGFKGVNDVVGYRGGDQVLLEAARRLETILRSGDVLARFAGDEFVILLEDLPDARRDAICVADRVLARAGRPVDVAGQAMSPRASVGIAIGTRGARPDTVLHEAETAMFRLKVAGQGRATRSSTAPTTRGRCRCCAWRSSCGARSSARSSARTTRPPWRSRAAA